jgi:hypothetical protein
LITGDFLVFLLCAMKTLRDGVCFSDIPINPEIHWKVQPTQHVWERREIHIKGRGNLGDLGVKGGVILKWIFEKQRVRVRTELQPAQTRVQ